MGGGDTAEEHVTWMLWAPTHPPTDKMASPFFMSAFCYFEFFTWEVYMFFLQLILVFCGLFWWQPWFGRPPPPPLDKMASPQPPLRSKYRMTLILQNTDTNMKYKNIRIQILNILIYTKYINKDHWTSCGIEILHDYKLFRIWSQIGRIFFAQILYPWS